ncbi:SGNH/GDSL hydrolase family protein [Pseudomonas sp. TWI929]|uniref:SGNH/GDSL hydrolase family protein n=1 Tax=Pseudomonas sp. TWI929 TaxID=3136795 RepID=UPI00320AFC08
MSGATDVQLFNQLVSNANALFLSDADFVMINGIQKPTLRKIYADFLASMGSFPTVAEGLANTSGTGTNNRFFNVPEAGNVAETRYRNDAGVAVQVNRISSASLVEAVAARAVAISGVSGSIVPVAVTDSGKVVVWLEDGKLAARGISEGLDAEIFSGRIASSTPTGSIYPVAVAGNQVAVWLEDGKLGARGLTDALAESVASVVTVETAPRDIPFSDSLPGFTDGRTLTSWRAKLGTHLVGGQPQKFKVGLMGDSWCELLPIPVRLRAYLGAALGDAGDGWQSVSTIIRSGSTLTLNGWTFLDADAAVSMPYGAGPDGMCQYSTSNTATMSLGEIRATDITIYFYNGTGTFRWRVDGGAWTSVTGTGATGTAGRVAISGLTDAVHTVEIDTADNTGTVAIYGFYTTRAGIAGVEVSRMGNAGLDSTGLNKYIGFDGSIMSDVNLDLLIVILGTNDYRRAGNSPAQFASSLRALSDKLAASNPRTGVIFVHPARTDGVVVNPQVEYRDAMYQMCLQAGREFYNMHDYWGTYTAENANNQFADSFHLNNAGAYRLSVELGKKFLML